MRSTLTQLHAETTRKAKNSLTIRASNRCKTTDNGSSSEDEEDEEPLSRQKVSSVVCCCCLVTVRRLQVLENQITMTLKATKITHNLFNLLLDSYYIFLLLYLFSFVLV